MNDATDIMDIFRVDEDEPFHKVPRRHRASAVAMMAAAATKFPPLLIRWALPPPHDAIQYPIPKQTRSVPSKLLVISRSH